MKKSARVRLEIPACSSGSRQFGQPKKISFRERMTGGLESSCIHPPGKGITLIHQSQQNLDVVGKVTPCTVGGVIVERVGITATKCGYAPPSWLHSNETKGERSSRHRGRRGGRPYTIIVLHINFVSVCTRHRFPCYGRGSWIVVEMRGISR